MANDIAFALNYTNLYEINIAPTSSTKRWARVGAGINSVSWGGNETVSQDPYYDGDGLAESDVTGGQIVGTFSGNRKFGDPAQDFIAGMLLDFGAGRRTDFRWTQPDGSVLEGKCTVANINPQGGDPNAKEDFGFEIHFNGAPTLTPGSADTFPTTITASDVSTGLTVGGTKAIGATVSPASASSALVYASGDESKVTVDSDGTLHGVAAGSAIPVTIKSAVKPSVTKQISVTVTASQ